jgi:hypothetical protein
VTASADKTIKIWKIEENDHKMIQNIELGGMVLYAKYTF